MILVTGATGQYGKAVIDFLLQKGTQPDTISALARDAAKAADLSARGITVRVGDYRDYDSLVEAFKGVDKLLLVSSSDMEDRSGQHINAIKAATEARVNHIIYTSFQRKNEVNSPIQMISEAHLVAEREIKASGLTYTILQNGLYADNLPWFLGEKVLETGIFMPAGNTKASYTTRLDMAEAGANILLGKGHENKIYQVASNENVSFPEIAAMLSEISGKTIPYVDPTLPEFIETLTKAGVPDMYVGMLAGFGDAIRQGEFNFDNNDLNRLLNREAGSLKDYLKSVYAVSW
jgi:NAD(P)H dehydrogenase (quinone)